MYEYIYPVCTRILALFRTTFSHSTIDNRVCWELRGATEIPAKTCFPKAWKINLKNALECLKSWIMHMLVQKSLSSAKLAFELQKFKEEF